MMNLLKPSEGKLCCCGVGNLTSTQSNEHSNLTCICGINTLVRGEW